MLQGMENPLTQQRKSCPAIPHPLDKLELVHVSLDQTVALGKGESGYYGCPVSFYSSDKPLQFADLACLDTLKPVVEPFSGARPQHLGELLNQFIRQIHLSVEKPKQSKRFLFVSIKFFRTTK